MFGTMNSGNEEIKYGKGEPTWIGNYRDKERDFTMATGQRSTSTAARYAKNTALPTT